MKTVTHQVDFCVVGGGMAGLFAAIAAAREGIRVALMHERPVLGGNASSEIRMWLYGARGSNNRETGLLEEISLESLYRNPLKNYSIWDSILYEKARFEPNLLLLLNCTCCDAKMSEPGKRVQSVKGWQMTTQTWHIVEAGLFADCSGDSILAPLSGADFRLGREAPEEFGERTLNGEADLKTMGNNCLIQLRKGTKPSVFIPPAWAKKLTEEDLRHHRPDLTSSRENFWFLELGGAEDVLYDAEKIKDDCLALSMGMVDYIKNSGAYDHQDAALWQLEFLSFLPGKRESRRYVGDYLMTEADIRENRRFEDAVSYGGWPCDDHQPLGFFCGGRIAKLWDTPEVYQIPYRTLYSRNVENLFCAGRNISLTHAAMGSARVMATCAPLGQAVGTAAALAARYCTSPRGVYQRHLDELQQRLLLRDVFIPGIPRRVSEVTRQAALVCYGPVTNPENLRNGRDRNNSIYKEESGASIPLGRAVEYRFAAPRRVSLIRLVFDSDLDRDTLPGDDWTKNYIVRCNINPDSPDMHLPLTLARAYRVEYEDASGTRGLLFEERENRRRLVLLPVDIEATAVTLTVESVYGPQAEDAHVFSFELY